MKIRKTTPGVSRLSQGLNKDAISKQNSAAMVEQLATMSQQRQKVIARNFANQFVKPLFHEIYRLVVENETQERVFEVAGNYVTIDPTTWSDQRDVSVELKLGYGEQDREAQKLMQLHQMFSQDPTLQPMYSVQNRYMLMKKFLEAQGILNVEDYLTPPDQLPPPQPDPAQQMQAQMAQKQMELQERQTAVAEQRVQVDAMNSQAKIELDGVKAEAAHAIASDNQDLKEAQFAHKKFIDEGELEILKVTEDRRGIVRALVSRQAVSINWLISLHLALFVPALRFRNDHENHVKKSPFSLLRRNPAPRRVEPERGRIER